MSKKFTYRAVWHDAGCVIFRSDGKRLPFKGRRLSTDDANKIGPGLIRERGAMWRRFE